MGLRDPQDVWIDEVLDDPEKALRRFVIEASRKGHAAEASDCLIALILWRKLDSIDDLLRALLERAR